MKKPATRIKSEGLANRLDFESTVDRISYVQTELRQLEAERDAAVQAAQALHAELIAELEQEQKAKLALCEKFAREHRAELLPGPAKSAETTLSRYGFRTGMPQLRTLRQWTWEKVLAAIQRRFGEGDYTRTKVELDKAAVLRELVEKGHLGTNTTPDLIGVRVAQEESFYIEPKVDGAEPVQAD